MSREIKFRFWDEENNRFWNGGDEGESVGQECFQTFFEDNCLVGAMGESVGVGFGECDFRVRQLPKSQYTGLKDSKGVEIYEGDICSTDLSRPYNVVVFRNGAFMYQCNDHDEDYFDIMVPVDETTDKDQYTKVLGNIYENPELLEEHS